MPTARPTAAAVSALPTWCAPTTASATAALPSGVTRVNRARSASSWVTSSARTSAPGVRPTVTTSAVVTAAIAATSGSSAFRMATPPSAADGSACTSSDLALAMASTEPNSPMCADPTLSTAPIRGGAVLASMRDVPDPAGGQFQHQEPGALVGAQRRVRVAELVVERLRRGDHLAPDRRPRSAARRRSGPWSTSCRTSR